MSVSTGKYEALRLEIRAMTNGDELYKVLKEELSVMNHWKCKPRGNSAKGREQQLLRMQGNG